MAYFLNRSQPIDSIAVLPFVNSNNDPDIEYLSDGITETLIDKLSQLPQLRGMARSTVFRFKGKGLPCLPNLHPDWHKMRPHPTTFHAKAKRTFLLR